MGWKYYHVGLNHVGAYQVAGKPYITGSATLAANAEVHYRFPKVARSVTVINFGNEDINVHFASKADERTIDGLHYIPLDSDEDSISMSVRLTNLYISNASGADNLEYRVIAELTPINTDNNPDLGTVGISE